MSFDSLLFFADAGNGDQFAFAIHDSSINTPDIMYGIMRMIVGRGSLLHLRCICGAGFQGKLRYS